MGAVGAAAAAAACRRMLVLPSRSAGAGGGAWVRGMAASAASEGGASSAKTTTNIVGLPVLENAREELLKVYKQILSEVKVVPEDAQYRKNVELLTRHRMKVVVEEEDLGRIEERIGMGQVEELHVQAVRELNLIPKMAGTERSRQLPRTAASARVDARSGAPRSAYPTRRRLRKRGPRAECRRPISVAARSVPIARRPVPRSMTPGAPAARARARARRPPPAYKAWELPDGKSIEVIVKDAPAPEPEEAAK